MMNSHSLLKTLQIKQAASKQWDKFIFREIPFTSVQLCQGLIYSNNSLLDNELLV